MSETLQTSPYLTHLSPGEKSPIRYLTDTFGPIEPFGFPAPEHARFGIVGLDRNVVWESDSRTLDVLRHCAAQPVSRKEVCARWTAALTDELVARAWLQPPDQLCREYHLRSGEIEVTAHCNWGCRFCPVATDPKPRRTMPMDLFEEIVAKLADLGTIEYVTFHFFNEPTLDKFFTSRLAVLRRYGLELALYTNASGLTQEKIDALADGDVLRHLIVNMPSVDATDFAALTSSRLFDRTMTNVDAAIAAGFRTQIVVNGVGADQQRNLLQITDRYGSRGAEVVPTMTCDRAGDVGDHTYHQGVNAGGRLSGCGWPVAHGNFSVNGDLFLCCNDYYQRETFGNIRDGSLDSLMTNEKAVRLRQRVFGVSAAADDFICRRCHNQRLDFAGREFRPIATFG
ncbi:radical SAM protein [Streptomyces sp. NPDC005892]